MKRTTWILGGLLLASLGAGAQTPKEGLKALENENYATASRIFRNAVAGQASAENLWHLGYYYVQTGKLDSAKSQFEAGMKADPKYALNGVGLGTVSFLKGDKAGAKFAFDAALKSTGGRNSEVTYRIAESYLLGDKPDPVEAIKLLETALKADAKNARLYLLLGDAFLMQNDASQATNNYDRRAKVYDPNLPAVYLRMGKVMERARNYTEAANFYKAGIERDASYGLLYKELGEVYFAARKFDDAVAMYTKYIELSDKNPLALLNYAGFLTKTKSYDKANAILTDIFDKVENPIKYRVRAYTYFETQKPKEAVADLEMLFTKLDEKKIGVEDYRIYAKAQIASGGDTAKAVAAYDKLIGKDSAEAVAVYRDLGEMLFKAKKYAQAAESYDKLVRLPKSTYYDALKLGQSYYYAKQYAQADTAFGTGLAKYPDQASFVYWKASALARYKDQGTTFTAKEWYQRYVDSNPDPATYKPYLMTSLKYLANCYAFAYKASKNSEDQVKSLGFIDKILSIDPNDAYAKEAKAALAKPVK